MSKSYIFAQFLFVTLLCRGLSEHQHSCPAERNQNWSYNTLLSNGPQYWGRRYPSCNGRMQSPVNINKADVRKDTRLEPLEMNNYDKPIQRAVIRNVGYTVVVIPQDGVDRTIMVNDMPYSLIQFHFHWGAKEDRGSDHTVNGKQYSMELHLVHENDNGGLAVVGVFYQTSFFLNNGLRPIVKSLEQILYKNDEVEMKDSIELLKLIDNKCSFYRYMGSLTTPPCYQGVIWSVCRREKQFGYSQMKAFRELFSVSREADGDDSECKISDNFRRTQPLNGREITSSL